ncbi:hypothetical protein EDD85DRAFT_105792 [Armillaria nabsnona]|nr:hypothetical protein EDD85DRAFT_105792 [Armillaria nabsnona]
MCENRSTDLPTRVDNVLGSLDVDLRVFSASEQRLHTPSRSLVATDHLSTGSELVLCKRCVHGDNYKLMKERSMLKWKVFTVHVGASDPTFFLTFHSHGIRCWTTGWCCQVRDSPINIVVGLTDSDTTHIGSVSYTPRIFLPFLRYRCIPQKPALSSKVSSSCGVQPVTLASSGGCTSPPSGEARSPVLSLESSVLLHPTNRSIPMANSALPPEIIDDILSGVWSSRTPSQERMQFMTTCSLLNRTWKAVFSRIASRDIYILSTKFFEYLCTITHSQASIIYGDLLPNSTRTITCHPDLNSPTSDPATEMYVTLCKQ